MDIVLVMDVTSSMRPYMEMVNARLIELVDRLDEISAGDLPVEVHIGVVAYSDYADVQMTATLNLTPDRRAVRRFLGSLRPFSRGVGKNEAVFEAMAAGIEDMLWGRHSYRVLLLVGDAPPHLPDDIDTQLFQANDDPVDTPFFGRTFERNVAVICLS